MKREKVTLTVSGIYADTRQDGRHIVELSAEGYDETLQVSLPEAEAEAVRSGMTGERSLRPQTHDLFTALFEVMGIRIMRVLLYRWHEGEPYFYIYIKSGGMLLRTEIRPSDALAMALRSQVTICIYQDVLENAFDGKDTPALATQAVDEEDNVQPLDNGYLEHLRQSLAKAIEQEDYERAAKLRDTINKIQNP